MYRLLAVPAVLLLAGCSYATKKTVVEPGPVARYVADAAPASIAWSEVYGTERPQIAVACPGDDPSDITRALGREWHENHHLALGDSAQVVFSTVDGYTDVEVLPRAVVDLCPAGDAPRSYRVSDVTALQARSGDDAPYPLAVVVP